MLVATRETSTLASRSGKHASVMLSRLANMVSCLLSCLLLLQLFYSWHFLKVPSCPCPPGFSVWDQPCPTEPSTHRLGIEARLEVPAGRATSQWVSELLLLLLSEDSELLAAPAAGPDQRQQLGPGGHTSPGSPVCLALHCS